MRLRCLVLALISAQVALVEGQTAGTLNVFLGDTVPITASQLSLTDVVKVTLTAQTPTSQCAAEVSSITIQGQSTSGFFIGIPPTICPGKYGVRATATPPGQSPTKDTPGLSISPQFLQVNEKAPLVTGISPKVVFLDEIPDKGLVLTFLGPASLKGDSKYSIRFRDHALPPCETPGSSTNKNCFEPGKSSDGQINFVLYPPLDKLSGKQSVSVIYNSAESDPQDLKIVSARRTTPRNYALVFTASLVVLVYLLLLTGTKALQTKPSTGNFLLNALFLDEETQTYSLSKCQFYAWTLAAILGYVFFAVAMSIVQGSPVFPDIPEGLPGILLFSAGTSVISTGIVSTKGNKGAGEVHPTLADFITTGGVIAPERLQFVIWTVVGIFTFLTIVFKSDPVTVSGLPRIPDGFLQLMGISSAGYLAGKLARKPGPVIKNLAVVKVTPPGPTPPNQSQPGTGAGAETTPAVLILNLKGENLDPKGNIKVDGQPLRVGMFTILDATPDPQSGFCSEFNVSLNNAGAYLEGTHTLTLVNNDAQAADAVFPISPMTIVSVDVPNNAPGATPDVTVTGTNFADPTTAEWRDEKGILLSTQEYKVESATTLKISRPATVMPGSKCKLILISKIGLKVSSKEI
jgi:hypothetical protein